MSDLDLVTGKVGFAGATFTLTNRMRRVLWQLTWILLARWTPPMFHRWRIFILNLFGAKVSNSAYVYSSVKIWAPWKLEMRAFASLGPEVRCYNIATVSIGRKTVVSQGVHLCTGSHDYIQPAFPLIARPITILDRAWICADAFVGPGVTIGEGAVLGGAAATASNLEPWTVYSGNPAVSKRTRPIIVDKSDL